MIWCRCDVFEDEEDTLFNPKQKELTDTERFGSM